MKSITKIQARLAIYHYDYANNCKLKDRDIYYLENESNCQTRTSKYADNIIKENDSYYYILKIEDDTYRYTIDTETMTVSQVCTINNETVFIPSLKVFLGDLTDEEQKQALENMYLGDIEKYASERTGIEIKFHKKLYQDRQGTWSLELYTDNLVEHAGICKAMLRTITADTRGNISYYIDKYTGEQKLSYINLHFSYEHLDGGTNGHEFGKVRFNDKTGNFEGYNYETNKYEVI